MTKDSKKTYPRFAPWLVLLGVGVFIGWMVWFSGYTQEKELQEAAEKHFGEKQVYLSYIGEGDTSKVGNYQYYEVKVGEKTYYVQTEWHRHRIIQSIEADNKEMLKEKFSIKERV